MTHISAAPCQLLYPAVVSVCSSQHAPQLDWSGLVLGRLVLCQCAVVPQQLSPSDSRCTVAWKLLNCCLCELVQTAAVTAAATAGKCVWFRS
jgi:hypothetical protein